MTYYIRWRYKYESLFLRTAVKGISSQQEAEDRCSYLRSKNLDRDYTIATCNYGSIPDTFCLLVRDVEVEIVPNKVRAGSTYGCRYKGVPIVHFLFRSQARIYTADQEYPWKCYDREIFSDFDLDELTQYLDTVIEVQSRYSITRQINEVNKLLQSLKEGNLPECYKLKVKDAHSDVVERLANFV